jgi:ABC-type lipoprotein release transport system permease subunit
VISLAQLESLEPDSDLPISAVSLRAPADAAPALREALASISPSLVLDSRVEETARFRAAPMISAVVWLLGAAIAVTAAYAALAIAASLAMAGAARAGEAAHLRALGLHRRQAILLVVAEHGSTIVIGFVAGTLLGLWLFSMLRQGLGLAALIGTDLAIPLSIDAVSVALLFAAIIAIAAIGIALSSTLERSSAPASAIRRGIE